MKRYTLLVLFAIGALLLGACGQSDRGNSGKKSNKALDVITLTEAAIRSIGLEVAPVETRHIRGRIVTTAEIKASDNNVFHVNSFSSGRVLKDDVMLGQVIRQGQVLAVIQNVEAVKIQAQYIHDLHQNEIDLEKAKTRYALAKTNLDRERRLWEEGIAPRRDYQQAEAESELARTDLQGQQEHKIHIHSEGKALLGAYGISPRMNSERIQVGSPILAPRAGTVTKKNVTLGDMVTPDIVMYELTDLSKVWLDITIYPKDIAGIQQGQSVAFSTDSLPGQTFKGKVDYFQPVTDVNSQTYIARTYLDNPTTVLKPGMLGQVQIDQKAEVSKAFIPAQAVQRYGRENFVFIPLKGNRFHKQTVVLGSPLDGGYLLESGLKPGQPVVTSGSFTLKAELLKNLLGENE